MSCGTSVSQLSGCVHFVGIAGSDLSRQERVSDGFNRSEF